MRLPLLASEPGTGYFWRSSRSFLPLRDLFMKKVFKWFGYIVGGVVAIIVVAVAGIYAMTGTKLAKTYPTEVETVAVPTDPAALERGRHMVAAVGKCQSCHGDNLAGAVVQDNAVFASVTSRNLTSGKGGLTNYTDADYVRAIRYGVGRNGKALVMMPSDAFYRFTDRDLGDMIAYLKSLPPIDAAVPHKVSVGPIARTVYLVSGGQFPMTPAQHVPRDKPRPASVPAGVTAEYGDYLVTAGACRTCHEPNLSGGFAPNITPGGDIGKWTEADFVKSIRAGTRPDGRVLSAVMPWPFMKDLTDDEIRAMWMYLRTVPPVTTPAK